jgi:RNA polymerase sigma-70 factor (ECF subfamily)
VIPEHEIPIRSRCDAGDWAGAATLIMERYGSELLGFLVATARSEVDGADAFSHFTEQMWRYLPRFRWAASARTWCYTLARRSLSRIRRDPNRKPQRAIALSDAPEVAALAERLRTETITYLRTETKDRVALLREQLDPDDQALLILRIDRKLEWRDVAIALADEETEELEGADLEKRAAAMRKRFTRIKADLKKQLEDLR